MHVNHVHFKVYSSDPKVVSLWVTTCVTAAGVFSEFSTGETSTFNVSANCLFVVKFVSNFCPGTITVAAIF